VYALGRVGVLSLVPLVLASCVAVLGDFNVGGSSTDAGGGGDGQPPPTDSGGSDVARDVLTTDGPSPLLLQGTTQVCGGGRHTCALNGQGQVFCWGANDFGQLGVPATPRSATPQRVAGITSAVKHVTCGLDHTCVTTADRTVLCWGRNQCGQLGGGGADANPHPQPVALAGPLAGSAAVGISAGQVHTCAFDTSGQLYCWGCNGDLVLGTGATDKTDHFASAPSIAPANVAGVGAATKHTCTVSTAGSGGQVLCWGTESAGELGNGGAPSDATGAPAPVATAEAGILAGAAITAGDAHTCMLDTNQNIWCWGSNGAGQLGIAGADTVDVTRRATGTAFAVDAGGAHTCALVGTNVLCWGSNHFGQLGRGGPPDDQPHPNSLAVQGAFKATGIGVGRDHSCAVTESTVVLCWGRNDDGQLGNNQFSLAPQTAPGPVVAP
jgi:alpha-tubulin suppressor-like RCC1 family protein